jgi:hypothetical protein
MGGCSGKIDLQTHGSKASKGSEQIGVRKASAASSDETPKEKENNARYLQNELTITSPHSAALVSKSAVKEEAPVSATPMETFMTEAEEERIHDWMKGVPKEGEPTEQEIVWESAPRTA